MSLKGRHRLSLWLRSLAMQGSWNFPRMQGLGFFYALAPWLRHVGGPETRKGLRRHLGYFNTHPYLSTYVLGAVARLEEEGRGEESVQVRDSLMGPLGAIGDGLYWAGFRPMCILAALLVSLVSVEAALVAFLLTYNAVHLVDRWRYLNLGYERAHEAVEGALSLRGGFMGRSSRKMMAPAAGFLLGFTVFRTGTPGTALLFFAVAFALYRRKWKTPAVLAVMLLIAVVLGTLGVRTGIPWSA